ncbi:MAG: class I SAM-dependent methyltransferase [Saprospiraceae bacterium]|nr:class I SAM-dependent methyltransferase [Saprospiraceae bacterium]MDW8228984.1 class I SAM-dependent methyltransferase [Saprospiraceae bacterium]
MTSIEAYLSGERLYGDDLSPAQIASWYEDEREGYAQLVERYGWAESEGGYAYHPVNVLYGYRYLPKNAFFERALGLGSATGNEFLPILSRIGSIDILEPSEKLKRTELNGVRLRYHKPSIEGDMPFPDAYFHLQTCFSTLHHIPNVSHVMRELHRCLAPGGFLLIREPVHSMGDWRYPRPMLTKHERGIPLTFFRRRIAELGFTVVRESLCLAMNSFLQRMLGKWLRRPLTEYYTYVYLDMALSRLTAFNLHYHPQNLWQRIAPQSVFYVLQKN